MDMIRFEEVSKVYVEGKPVVKDLSFAIKAGELITLVGPSGCGKTTILRMVNKLLDHTAGKIYVKDRALQDWDTTDLRRSIGYVIQQIGLLPHLTVEDNITYVLGLKKVSKEAKKKRAKELIQLVGMDPSYLDRYPRALSGGQQQRIGVARALAGDPDIVLMDEPFGAVDEIARRKLQEELKELHGRLKKTIIFVTHDIEEALKLGTRVVLLRDGQIEQAGSPKDLIYNPASDFVKSFFGIKGFQATMDETLLRDAYEAILRGERTLEDLRFDQ